MWYGIIPCNLSERRHYSYSSDEMSKYLLMNDIDISLNRINPRRETSVKEILFSSQRTISSPLSLFCIRMFFYSYGYPIWSPDSGPEGWSEWRNSPTPSYVYWLFFADPHYFFPSDPPSMFLYLEIPPLSYALKSQMEQIALTLSPDAVVMVPLRLSRLGFQG